MKRATGIDVARRAGVSRATVSYVVNNKSGGGIRISDATRRRVLAVVEELGYRPSRAAVSLRTQRSNLISVMIPHIDSPFHPHFASSVQDEAERFDVDVQVYGTRDDYDRESRYLGGLIERSIDGLIVHSYQLQTGDLATLVDAGVAVVVIGPEPTHPLADNLVFDERAAVSRMIQAIAERGHHRIGHIAGPLRTWAANERLLGYRDGLAAARLPYDQALVVSADFYVEESGGTAMERLMRVPDPPTAVFCSNDFLAVSALLYCQDRGIRVPRDLAIVGIDGLPLAERIRPRLTTIRKDYRELARLSVASLVERINATEPLPARSLTLECRPLFRESL